jgi:hypothetical protein
LRFVDYHCHNCGETIVDVFYKSYKDVKETIQCNCGKRAKRIWAAGIYIDDWSPMTNDAIRDIEHFEKKRVKNGQYVGSNIYRSDKIKQSVNHLENLRGI